ncbi:MAG: glutamyl-tRNA reductase [Myxococcales bacterium]|nr:glutamyl-tRNA reductase [Myxococcales bacterium]
MLVVTGLSHHTAPVDVRERAAFQEGELEEANRRLAGHASETMILSTCNRVEIYLTLPDPAGAAERGRRAVEKLLAEVRLLDAVVVGPHLYTHTGEDAVRHLFRVASSLDSMVVGEPQILGQVKDAFQHATRAGTIRNTLGRVLQRAFAAAKRVRTETEVARSSSSVASAAVELARHIFGDLTGKEVLVIGAGKMGDLAARHLVSAGAGPLLVTNRTFERAQSLAGRIGGKAHPWESLPQLLTVADIVLCSTGAPEPVVKREMVQRAMKARRGRWLCFIDIAVPRDVEAQVGDVENVYLYDVDALSSMVDDHLAERRREAEIAERIIAEEVQRFLVAERSLGVVPTIRALREQFSSVARAEVARTLGKLEGASQHDRRVIEALAEAIVNKLLHAPLTALKREGESDGLVSATRTLFAIEEPPASGTILPPLPPPGEGRGEGPLETGSGSGSGSGSSLGGTLEAGRAK